MSYGSEYYPYHSGYERSYDGQRLNDWSQDASNELYGGFSAYEQLGSGIYGPRADYYGAGYEPFSVMDPFVNGNDGSMEHYGARYGYGVDRYGEASDIPPRHERMLREDPQGGFDDDYRWPPGDEWELATRFQYLNSEDPWRDGVRGVEVPPWHASRRIHGPRDWDTPMQLDPAYGGEFGVMDFSSGAGNHRLEDDYYW